MCDRCGARRTRSHRADRAAFAARGGEVVIVGNTAGVFATSGQSLGGIRQERRRLTRST
ncbi:protein of unknown function (plasmid) [Caballeronia sp. S22]